MATARKTTSKSQSPQSDQSAAPNCPPPPFCDWQSQSNYLAGQFQTAVDDYYEQSRIMQIQTLRAWGEMLKGFQQVVDAQIARLEPPCQTTKGPEKVEIS